MSELNQENQTENSVQELEDLKVNNQVFKVQKGFSKIFGETIANQRKVLSQENKEIQKQIEALNLTLEEKENILKSYEDKTISQEKILEMKFQSEIKKYKNDFEKVSNEKQELFSNFEKQTITNDLNYAIFNSGKEVYNPKQVLASFKDFAKISFEKIENNYCTVCTILENGQELKLSPKEAMEKFLSLEENLNLLKPDSRQSVISRIETDKLDFNSKEGRLSYLKSLKNSA